MTARAIVESPDGVRLDQPNTAVPKNALPLFPYRDNHVRMSMRNQTAAPGFVVIERWLVSLFGTNERVLRALPLVAGLLTCMLAPWFATGLLDHRRDAAIVVALVSFSEPLVRYATELHPYAVDSLATILLVGLAAKPTAARFGLSILASGVMLWLSFPAVFAAAGAVSAALLATCKTADRRLRICAVAFTVAATAMWIGLYVTTIRSRDLTDVKAAFAHHMAPQTVSADLLYWTGNRVLRLCDYLWPGYENFVLAFAVVGAWRLVAGRRWHTTVLLVVPLAAVFIASLLHRYPMSERHLLFAGPLVLVLVGAGLGGMAGACGRASVGARSAFVVVLVAFFVPALRAVGKLRPDREEFRPVMKRVLANRRPHEAFFVHYLAEPAFAWYGRNLAGDVIYGNDPGDDVSNLLSEIDATTGGCGDFWLLLTHLTSERDKDFLVAYCRRTHDLVQSEAATEAWAYHFIRHGTARGITAWTSHR